MTSGRLTQYYKLRALADEPTPARRLLAAVLAGLAAFGCTQLLLGVVWGAAANALLFSSVAFAVAAAFAAATMKRARSVIYGMLAAIWLLIEGLVVMIGLIAACLG